MHAKQTMLTFEYRRDRHPRRSVCNKHRLHKMILSEYGKIADKYINQLSDFYPYLSVLHYVIMPNHIHIMLHISETIPNGPSRTPVPTIQNSIVSRFVSTFKRFCNKEYGENIWQARSYDHVIRDYNDYEKHINYIIENPNRWFYDDLYYE